MAGRARYDEADRIAALHGYGILDSADTTVFDDFVHIAAEICQAPIAVVNLIDASRQWFAAEIGLGVRETPVEVSICAQTLLQSEMLVVPDLTLDRRFDCNPLVTGAPGLRFYGGALLETLDGLPLGTVCVLDYEPRPQGLTARQAETLKALARQVMAQLELRRMVAEKELLVREAHHRVKNSLQMVQSLLLLQARSASPEVAVQLRESAARIHSFGAMHEHLYAAGAALEVNLAEYLARLVVDFEAQATAFGNRPIRFSAVALPWPSADAAPVGLIATELVTNALKYGKGAVTIDLARDAAGGGVLTVADEGTLPVGFTPAQSKGLGMRVLTSLLAGRNGALTIDRSRGHTRFVATMRARSHLLNAQIPNESADPI